MSRDSLESLLPLSSFIGLLAFRMFFMFKGTTLLLYNFLQNELHAVLSLADIYILKTKMIVQLVLLKTYTTCC